MQNPLDRKLDSHEFQNSKLHEAITAASHVTLEFGTGDMPLFEFQSERSFNADKFMLV